MDRQDAKDARRLEEPADFLVAQRLIVELKTVDQFAPVHLAQALSYSRRPGFG